jgi:Trypsin
MRAILAALAVCAALPALAQDTGLVSLQTADAGRDWQAVGRLDLGSRGFCTGTLIAPDLVLTAAHCLFDKETGARNDVASIEFLAGWRNGRAEAYRHISRALPHPEYVYGGQAGIDRVGFDIALLQLDQPILLPSIQPMPTAAAPRVGAEVGVVSYARGLPCAGWQARCAGPELQCRFRGLWRADFCGAGRGGAGGVGGLGQGRCRRAESGAWDGSGRPLAGFAGRNGGGRWCAPQCPDRCSDAVGQRGEGCEIYQGRPRIAMTRGS